MKYLITLLITLLPLLGFAQGMQPVGCVVVPATTNYYCNACPDGTNGADQLCEQPDGTSDGLCNWTIATETNADVNFAAAVPGTMPCTDQTNYAIKLTKSDSSTSEIKVYKTASGSTFYVQKYFYLETIPAGQTLYLFTLADNSNLPAVRVRVTYENPNYLVYWGYYQSGVWTESGIAASLNTWLTFRLYVVNSTSDTIQFWLDKNGDGDFSDADEAPAAATGKTLARDTLRYMFGTGADTNAPYTYYLMGLKVDDDTMPDVCAR